MSDFFEEWTPPKSVKAFAEWQARMDAQKSARYDDMLNGLLRKSPSPHQGEPHE